MNVHTRIHVFSFYYFLGEAWLIQPPLTCIDCIAPCFLNFLCSDSYICRQRPHLSICLSHKSVGDLELNEEKLGKVRVYTLTESNRNEYVKRVTLFTDRWCIIAPVDGVHREQCLSCSLSWSLWAEAGTFTFHFAYWPQRYLRSWFILFPSVWLMVGFSSLIFLHMHLWIRTVYKQLLRAGWLFSYSILHKNLSLSIIGLFENFWQEICFETQAEAR